MHNVPRYRNTSTRPDDTLDFWERHGDLLQARDIKRPDRSKPSHQRRPSVQSVVSAAIEVEFVSTVESASRFQTHLAAYFEVRWVDDRRSLRRRPRGVFSEDGDGVRPYKDFEVDEVAHFPWQAEEGHRGSQGHNCMLFGYESVPTQGL